MLEEGVEDAKPWNDTVPDDDIGIGCSTGNMLNEPDVSSVSGGTYFPSYVRIL